MASPLAVPVTTVATAIYTPQNANATLIVSNVGASILYLGQSGVTAATGLPIFPGQTINLTRITAAVYAVADTDLTKTPTDTISATVTAGDTALTVVSGGASFTNGMSVAIQDGPRTEIVTAGAGSTGTSVVVSATAFGHAIGVKFGQFQGTQAGCVTVVGG